MLFFGRQWPRLMIIHFTDLHAAVRILPSLLNCAGSPFLTAPSPPDSPTSLAPQAWGAPVTDASLDTTSTEEATSGYPVQQLGRKICSVTMENCPKKKDIWKSWEGIHYQAYHMGPHSFAPY